MGAVLPIVEAATAIFGAISQSNAQRQAASAASAAAQNQSNKLAQSDALAKQLAQGPYLQSLIDAEGSGVKTFESTIGGVANPGELVKQLFGGNIESALSASLGQRSQNIGGAINALQGSAGQYGGIAGAARSGAGGNPWTQAAGSIFSSLSQLGKKPAGTGFPGGTDVSPPPLSGQGGGASESGGP
jgi:hypothetical protein